MSVNTAPFKSNAGNIIDYWTWGAENGHPVLFMHGTMPMPFSAELVVDMERIISNMMSWFGISKEGLEKEREISTPAKTLFWDYYEYVLEYPVTWRKPTSILYGAADSLCEFEYVQNFAEYSHADMTVLEEGDHYFHTKKQLDFYRSWLKSKI